MSYKTRILFKYTLFSQCPFLKKKEKGKLRNVNYRFRRVYAREYRRVARWCVRRVNTA